MKALASRSFITSAVAIAALAASGAHAAVFNPFDVVAPGTGTSTHAFTADKITGNYNETVTFHDNNTFDVALYWSAGQFVGNGGQTAYNANETGLGGAYGIYALYKASGTVTKSGSATTFTFDGDGGSLMMYLDRALNTTVDMPGTADGAFVLGANGDDVLLADGVPLSGVGTLDPALSTCVGSGGSGINCGSFGTSTSFGLTGAGKAFFVSPNPFYNLSFQSGHLNNFSPSGTQEINGSLDVVFDNGARPVPEPATLALLGLGLLGVGAVRRKKQA
jgi:hypothetical protein